MLPEKHVIANGSDFVAQPAAAQRWDVADFLDVLGWLQNGVFVDQFGQLLRGFGLKNSDFDLSHKIAGSRSDLPRAGGQAHCFLTA